MKGILVAGGHEGALHEGGEGRLFAMNAECMLYIGRLGTSMRMLGSVTAYVSQERPFLFKCDGGAWQELDCVLLPPQVPHQIVAADTMVSVLVEPESIEFAALAEQGSRLGRCDSGPVELRDGLRRLGASLPSDSSYASLLSHALDAVVSNASLERKDVDPRILKVLDRINTSPYESVTAEQCAEIAGLSFSRFLHLFKEEVGLSFRRFKAWKRARRILDFVDKSPNLTDVALEIGYQDSSHFSHSIRKVYGLRPKDIFADSRRLAMHSYAEAAYLAN